MQGERVTSMVVAKRKSESCHQLLQDVRVSQFRSCCKSQERVTSSVVAHPKSESTAQLLHVE